MFICTFDPQMKRIKSYIAYLAYRLLNGGLSILPKAVTLDLLNSLLNLIGYRKDVIRANLAAAYPSMPDLERDRIRYQFYKSLSKTIISQVSGARTGNISFHNVSLIHALGTEYDVVLLLGSHYGCWESVGKMLTPELTEFSEYVAYKRLKNSYINRYLIKKRSDTIATPIEMKSLYRTIVKNLNSHNKSIYYLIADQYPSSLKNIETTTFLNQETRFINGPQRMALKHNIPVLFMDIKIDNIDDTTKVSIVPVYIPKEHSGEQVIARYSKLLEQQINRNPAHWLWSHRRWKNIRK